MFSILNYGMGNIRSIQNALAYLGVKSSVVESSQEILRSTKLILPGVGSFAKVMKNIRENLTIAVKGRIQRLVI